MERRNFLLIVDSPELDPEHVKIVRAVEYHSGGDFIEVFKHTSAARGSKSSGSSIPFVVAYFFSTETHPSEMGFGLLNGDRYLLLEIGGLCWLDGYSRARNWLERRQQK
jgi:hypothetical protein